MIRWLLFQLSLYWDSENVSSIPGQFLHACRGSTQCASNGDFARSREKVSVTGQDDVDRRHRSASSWLNSECLLHIRIARGGLKLHLQEALRHQLTESKLAQRVKSNSRRQG